MAPKAHLGRSPSPAAFLQMPGGAGPLQVLNFTLNNGDPALLEFSAFRPPTINLRNSRLTLFRSVRERCQHVCYCYSTTLAARREWRARLAGRRHHAHLHCLLRGNEVLFEEAQGRLLHRRLYALHFLRCVVLGTS